jgi:hypothetical protein
MRPPVKAAPLDREEERQLPETPPGRRMPFGLWLLRQNGRHGWMAMLVSAARGDPRFPRDGSPKDVTTRLRELHAEYEIMRAVAAAEQEWKSL